MQPSRLRAIEASAGKGNLPMQAVQAQSTLLVVPETEERETYPGGIEPGYYTRNEVVALLREHKDNPSAIQFIADMLEH